MGGWDPGTQGPLNVNLACSCVFGFEQEQEIGGCLLLRRERIISMGKF